MEMLFEIMMRISLKQFNLIKTWAQYEMWETFTGCALSILKKTEGLY